MSEKTAHSGAHGESGGALRMFILECPECGIKFYSELPREPDDHSKVVECVECESPIEIEFEIFEKKLDIQVSSDEE